MKMKVFLLLGAIAILCSCEKSSMENVSKPKYFFSWSEDSKTGSCKNKEGVEGYNPRFIGPCGDLRGYNFSINSLDGVDLRGAILDGMNLGGISLNGANLMAVKARGTVFSDSQLNGAKLRYGHFEGSKFSNTQLNGADLRNGFFSGVILDEASLFGANLSESDLGGAVFTEKLDTANLKNARVTYGTRLPFDEKMASNYGMKQANAHNDEIAKKQSAKKEERAPASQDEVSLTP